MSEIRVNRIAVSTDPSIEVASPLNVTSTPSRLRFPVWTTSTRPASPVAGDVGHNSQTGITELWVGDEWIPLGYDSKLGAVADRAATSATEILLANPGIRNGYYWIKPTSASTPKYVYCDMTTDGGGWMLLINARANNGGQYYNNNEFGLSSVNGISRVVEFDKSTTSMFGKSEINEFFQIPGFKYGRMNPTFGTSFNSPFTGLYQRIGTTVDARWGGTEFDCSNRSNLTNPTYEWVLTQYQNWSEVQSGTNSQTGSYTGSNHYYPTTYANANQNFWKGDADGIRFSTSFRSEEYSGRNTLSGYFWLKTT